MIKDITTSISLDSGSSTTIFSYQVPAQSKAYLKKFGQLISDFSAVGSVIWQIQRNGNPVYPYENIKEIIGNAYQPIDTQNIEFQGGDLLSVVITNNYTTSLNVGIRIVFEVI